MAAESLLNKVLHKVKQEHLFKKRDKVILACSGGPDSLALLDILAQLKFLLYIDITAAYFNHGLRPRESKKEKEYVEKLSAGYGVDFISGKGNVQAFARKKKISLQEAARYLRYNFLFKTAQKLNIRKIVLGHHRDDSAETILLGFLKGALRGISGIETVRKRDKFLLVRPMCGISKNEIISYLSQRGLEPCLDSSNLKKTYLRNRLRLEIMPILKKDINPRVDEAILRLGDIYSRENEYLNEIVSKNIKKVIKEKRKRIYIDKKDFLKFHIAIERRILREVFDRLGIIGEGSNFRQIEILRNFISTCSPGQTLDLARGFIVKGGYPQPPHGDASQDGFAYGHIFIEKRRSKPKRIPSTLRKLNVPGETRVKDLNISIVATMRRTRPLLRDMKKAFPEKVFLDADKIKLPLYLRTRKPGDSFRPLGMKGTVKLKKYFINSKIPREERKFIPLAGSGKEIIWVVGYVISEKVKITSSTKNVLALRQIPLPRYK